MGGFGNVLVDGLTIQPISPISLATTSEDDTSQEVMEVNGSNLPPRLLSIMTVMSLSTDVDVSNVDCFPRPHYWE